MKIANQESRFILPSTFQNNLNEYSEVSYDDFIGIDSEVPVGLGTEEWERALKEGTFGYSSSGGVSSLEIIRENSNSIQGSADSLTRDSKKLKVPKGPGGEIGISSFAAEVLGLESLLDMNANSINRIPILDIVSEVSSISLSRSSSSESDCTKYSKDARIGVLDQLDFDSYGETLDSLDKNLSLDSSNPRNPLLDSLESTVQNSNSVYDSQSSNSSSDEFNASEIIEETEGIFSFDFRVRKAETNILSTSTALGYVTKRTQTSRNVDNSAALYESIDSTGSSPFIEIQGSSFPSVSSASSSSAIDGLDSQTDQESLGNSTGNGFREPQTIYRPSEDSNTKEGFRGTVYRPGSETGSRGTVYRPESETGSRGTLNRPDSIPVSEDIEGLSVEQSGKENFRNNISKISNGTNIKDVNSFSESSREPMQGSGLFDVLISGITTSEAASGDRTSGPSGSENNISNSYSAESTDDELDNSFSSFNISQQPLEKFEKFTSNLESILRTLGGTNSGTAGLVPEASSNLKETINSTLQNLGQYAGQDKSLFLSETSCFRLKRETIDFLFYNMFLTIVSLTVKSLKLESTSSLPRGTRKKGKDSQALLVKFLPCQAKKDMDLLEKISGFEGQLEDSIRDLEGLRIQSKIFDSIGYCIDSRALTKERLSVFESFLNTYLKASNDLNSLGKNASVSSTLRDLQTKNSQSVLEDISIETVSAAQLNYIEKRGPLNIPRISRLARTAESAGLILSREVYKSKGKNSILATVGIPAKSIEFLRRNSGFQTDSDYDLSGKEYLELSFTRREIAHSDLVYRDASFRFCPNLHVVPQIVKDKGIKSAARKYLYLCYDGKKWNVKNFTDALKFVMDSTGLSRNLSLIIVYNHVIDAISKMTMFGLSGILFDSSFGMESKEKLSSGGYLDLKKTILSSVASNAITKKGLTMGDFLSEESDPISGKISYSFKELSSLSSGVVSKTDEASHRLLGLISKDPIFTFENYYGGEFEIPPFERIYTCLINTDDFHIDKPLTSSTVSGNSTLESMTKFGKLKVFEDCAVSTSDDTFSTMDANEFAVKVTLVSG